MADESPTLEVGFEINFGDAFGQLRSLDDIVGETAARVYREAQAMEKALGGGFGLSGSTAQITSFGNAVSRQMQEIKRETDRAEKSGEALVRRMEREIEVFGKSASEIRQMRAEMRAVEADSRGLTELAGRIRAASGQLDVMEASSGRLAATSNKASFALRQTALQLPDIIGGLMTGQKPMQVFIQQGGQLAQVAQMAEGGVKGFGKEIGIAALRFAPFIGVAGAAVGAFALFDRAVSKGVDTKAMIAGLGLTHDEIKRLKDTSVTTGDVMRATFEVLADRVGISLTGMSKAFGSAMDYLTTAGRLTLAGLYAGFVGTFGAIAAIIEGGFTGRDAGAILKAAGKAYTDSFNEADKALKRFGADVTKQIGSDKLKALQKQADELKADRHERKPKTDRHAEQLERDAQAVEAQIAGLYRLADAYGVSGAAALIAEARVKAESKAIRQRADIEAAVDREIRLAVAQRVADAAKGTAAMAQQAALQAQVNAEVAAGNVPAALANQLLQDRIADLPLLAALQAAQKIKDQTGIDATTKALDEQRAARERLNDEEAKRRLTDALALGGNRLAELREEARLIGATDAERVKALATLRATQEAEANGWNGEKGAEYVRQQVQIAVKQEDIRAATAQMNAELRLAADLADDLATSFSRSFGKVGDAIGQTIRALGHYGEEQQKIADMVARGQIGADEGAKRSANAQLNGLIDITDAAKGLFKEHSRGYQAMMAAEQALTVVQLARTAVDVAGGAARMFASLGPWAFPAVAAMVGVMASLGFSASAGSAKLPKSADGSGTVLGDTSAKSDSIKNAIDSLKAVDTLTNGFAREMAASLKSIDSQIGGLASVLVRAGDINASAGVDVGFKTNTTGKLLSGAVDPTGLLSKVPILGDAIGAIKSVINSLFGSKTSVIGNGLYGGPQSLGSVLNGGFDASYYSDIEKKKKFFGVTVGKSYSTQYGAADSTLENQFTLILRQFNDAIVAAAGPLGAATTDIQNRLNGFVLNIGKIDLKGLTGAQIQEKLTAIFGAAADSMANAAFPGFERFQEVGEGAFETLVRVASTVEAVTSSLDLLGASTQALGIDVKMGLANQFDSVSDFTSAANSYFEAFYSQQEQATAKTAQLGKVFGSLGLTMPNTLAAFRSLVEAQDLTTAAGQATYATLLKLAPAFADLKSALDGARSAADILTERQDLQRQILELNGDTAAIRALELAKLDPSNRALQQQIYSIQDAQKAADAAEELRQAWTSVGDSIMDEVKRIRGLTGTSDGSFATLMGQFNAATTAARGGDQDAAKSLPGLSQSLLNAAAQAATSRQELDRIQAQTAASLEATYGVIGALMGKPASAGSSASALAAAAATQANAAQPVANDDTATELRALRAEVAQLRTDNNAGHAATAGNTGKIARTMDNVTQASGGDAISVASTA